MTEVTANRSLVSRANAGYNTDAWQRNNNGRHMHRLGLLHSDNTKMGRGWGGAVGKGWCNSSIMTERKLEQGFISHKSIGFRRKSLHKPDRRHHKVLGTRTLENPVRGGYSATTRTYCGCVGDPWRNGWPCCTCTGKPESAHLLEDSVKDGYSHVSCREILRYICTYPLEDTVSSRKQSQARTRRKMHHFVNFCTTQEWSSLGS